MLFKEKIVKQEVRVWACEHTDCQSKSCNLTECPFKTNNFSYLSLAEEVDEHNHKIRCTYGGKSEVRMENVIHIIPLTI